MDDDIPSTTSRRIVLILALAIATSLGVGEAAPPVTVATSVQVVDESSSISGAVAERRARRRIRRARRRSRRSGPRRLRLSLLRSEPRSVHGWTDPPLRGPPARRVT